MSCYWHSLLLSLLFLIVVTQHFVAYAEFGVSDVVRERCIPSKYRNMVETFDDVEDLKLNVSVHIALDKWQRKRFLLKLNHSTPLTIAFSHNVARKIYFNQTANLLRAPATTQRGEQPRQLLLPCALRGQYDLFVQARQRGSIKIEAQAAHPQDNWPLLNRTHRINIRTQNRVRKRQMIVKWERSKFDFFAMHYCLIVNTHQAFTNFCSAIDAFYTRQSPKSTCLQGPLMDDIWLRSPERGKKIDAHGVNIICTGSRTQQLLRAIEPNTDYYLDVFGVHTRRQNLTFHMASTRVHFSRTHPSSLRPNALSMVKISGLHGVQVFSYKVPTPSAAELPHMAAMPTAKQFLRYLILPCGGSELNVKIMRQRRVVGNVQDIYRPTYIKLSTVQPDERYLMRFEPSNEDEKLRANKVGLAVTNSAVFQNLPELPENITVFEVRTRCKSTTIAWYSAPESRTMSYCIIVLNLPQRNRSSIDYTNYCMDFGKRIVHHPQFHSIKCMEKYMSPPTLESEMLFNLMPGDSYLIYVTANLSDGRPLPYQSLRVHVPRQCYADEFNDAKEQTVYY